MLGYMSRTPENSSAASDRADPHEAVRAAVARVRQPRGGLESGGLGSGWTALDRMLGGGQVRRPPGHELPDHGPRELELPEGGGWPAGALVEICGRGGTSLALGAVRSAQRVGCPTAWVDGSHSFCPATADVDFERLNLVRPALTGSASPETGAGARSGRRRGRRGRSTRPLFAADLLLRSRAFGLVVLDAPRGGTGAGPWFRLARLADRAHTCLLLLTGQRRSVAGSAATVLVDVSLPRLPGPVWSDLPAPVLEVTVRRHRLVEVTCWPASCLLPNRPT